ncbi:MAG TPA: PIG-L family deacetylase [Aggregatilineaceae bacterium]|nr:PIG-L family deacetylase [Aggregatilineaceae bacterium]
MKFRLDTAQIFVPDGLSPEEALARTTHLGISAHQDDLEIMAMDGILRCFQREDKWFTGVVVTNGAGSPRADLYAQYTDGQMQLVRIKEQKKAATVGEYAAQVFLDYSSAAVKDGANKQPVEDLAQVIQAARPDIVYTHNLADKHPTHVGVAVKVIAAIRSLPETDRPHHLYGCEVWRDLDWLIDEDKIAFDLSMRENLQLALLGVFDSQITGGKRYDLATMGRRRAHATYHASHDTDVTTGLTFAMDLTPLIQHPTKDILEYVQEFIDRFTQDVSKRISGVL